MHSNVLEQYFQCYDDADSEMSDIVDESTEDSCSKRSFVSSGIVEDKENIIPRKRPIFAQYRSEKLDYERIREALLKI